MTKRIGNHSDELQCLFLIRDYSNLFEYLFIFEFYILFYISNKEHVNLQRNRTIGTSDDWQKGQIDKSHGEGNVTKRDDNLSFCVYCYYYNQI